MNDEWTTTTPPKVPGWYWVVFKPDQAGPFWPGDDPNPVKMVYIEEQEFSDGSGINDAPVQGYADECWSLDALVAWMGPLPIPDPPALGG